MRRRTLLGSLLGSLAGSLAATGCSPAPRPRPVEGARLLPERYGDHPLQVADLHLPPDGTPVAGVVELVHGGYWQRGYDRSLQDAVAADLVTDGWAVWNLDYRTVGDGGGWPETLDDAAAGTDLLAEVAARHALDLSRLAVVGHSAGGQLAAWLAARHRLPDDAPGARPRVRPVAACAQAGVLDLVAGAEQDLGAGAVESLLEASPAQRPDRYAVASPAQLLPTGADLLVVTGADDDVVPPELSERYAALAHEAGDAVRLEVVPGEGHFEHLDPASRCWRVVREWLDGVARQRG